MKDVFVGKRVWLMAIAVYVDLRRQQIKTFARIRHEFLSNDTPARRREVRAISEETKVRLGVHRGRRFYLTTRVSPSFDNIQTFSVVVYYRDPRTGRSVQIARIDPSHGFVHVDRLYRRDQPKEPIDADVWEAAEYLEANWRRFARSHDRAHAP